MLEDKEIHRYARQLDIPDWDRKIQAKLKDASVFVAGAGGLGSPLLYYLTAAGVGNITLCDNDTVEMSNLNRQIFYSVKDIGHPKALKASEVLKELNENIKINHQILEINEKTILSIEKTDLIIDCLDNFDTRFILNRISVEKCIPMIHAGVSGYSGQLTFLIPGETPCLSCFMPENIINTGSGIIGATAGIIGSMQAMEAIKFLTGIGELLSNRLLFVDSKSMSFSEIKIRKNPNCKICSVKGR